MFLLAILYLFDVDGILKAVLFSAVFHEVGHYLVAKFLGSSVSKIKLSATGAEMILDVKGGYFKEILINISGPIFSIILAVLASKAGYNLLGGVSLIVGLFNALPILPLDGGKVVQIILLMSNLGYKAYLICAKASLLSAILIFVLGVVVLFKSGHNITLLIIGSFLLMEQNHKDLLI